MSSSTDTDKPTAETTPPVLKGSCLCRAIQFTLTGPPFNTGLCHCANCAHVSGVGFVANSYYHISQLHLPTTPALKSYTDSATDSGAAIQRQFCGVCGSPLFTRKEGAERVAVASGSLEREEGEEEWRPRMEVYCKGRSGWLGVVEGARRWVGMPGEGEGEES